MDPINIILEEEPKPNDLQYKLLKSVSQVFQFASVSKTQWSGHLKPLFNDHEEVYKYIDIVSKGQIIPQLLDKFDNMIKNHSLMKCYLENIILYGVKVNQDPQDIVTLFYN